ncbi:MAG: FecR domain-containing protein [Thermoanaerobaculia bacterium]|nr:FecR domain-containing protein [Thermoanaerobaculia bacterium]
MESNQRGARTQGWYTVSLDTLRVLGGLGLLLLLAGGGWLGWRVWNERALEREAGFLLDEVRVLLERASRERPATGAFSEEYEAARASHTEAQAAWEQRDFAVAVPLAQRSRNLLLAVLGSGDAPGGRGEAQFIAVQGSVELRRGDQGEWEPARVRDVLRSGDYVKTAGGSAEIVFLDGTLYTVRPNTLFVVTRERSGPDAGGSQAISMEYGWVNLDTAKRGGRVTTPRAEARVGSDSEAAVSVDAAGGVTRFAAYRGEVEVTSEAGVTRRLGPLEQVTQTGALLAEAEALPGAPLLLEPGSGHQSSLDGGRELMLSWEAVPGAPQYALQVSRSRLFVDNLIDVESRSTTAARLGLRGEGTFEWRVSARSRAGLQGPWSEPRTFRVVAASRVGDRGDTTPPMLEIDQVQAYGNMFIFHGRTEPGAVVTVAGETAPVASDGSFTKTVQVARDGWNLVELTAADASGNVERMRHRVFVETL